MQDYVNDGFFGWKYQMEQEFKTYFKAIAEDYKLSFTDFVKEFRYKLDKDWQSKINEQQDEVEKYRKREEIIDTIKKESKDLKEKCEKLADDLRQVTR